jgi:hypothetical protein
MLSRQKTIMRVCVCVYRDEYKFITHSSIEVRVVRNVNAELKCKNFQRDEKISKWKILAFCGWKNLMIFGDNFYEIFLNFCIKNLFLQKNPRNILQNSTTIHDEHSPQWPLTQ